MSYAGYSAYAYAAATGSSVGGNKTGLIVGLVVGLGGGLSILAGGFFFLMRRYRRIRIAKKGAPDACAQGNKYPGPCAWVGKLLAATELALSKRWPGTAVKPASTELQSVVVASGAKAKPPDSKNLASVSSARSSDTLTGSPHTSDPAYADPLSPRMISSRV